jgi:Domain of Unknown Function with PDB structure (DUF3857)
MRHPRRAIRRVALCLLAAGAIGIVCSVSARAGDDWQPIDPADLALKDNPKSPGADAMILYREDSIDENNSSIIEYMRIKIFTQTGAKYGDIEIPYAKGFSNINNLKARTIRPDGSIVEFQGKPFDKMIVKSGGVKVLAKTFTLPDVSPGCIIEYRYREQRDVENYINEQWVVQGDLYLRNGRFAIRPYIGPNAQQLAMRRYWIPEESKIQKQPNGEYALEVHDIPGLEIEDYMPPADSMRARVDFFYRGWGVPSDETEEQYWSRTGKTMNAFVDQFVDKKGALEKDLANTVSPGDSPEIKLEKIYARVQRIRNLSLEDEKSAKEEHQEKLKENSNAEDVLKHGYAYNRQINYAFVGLARAAGFDAHELFIVPRNENYFNPKLEDSGELQDELVWVNAGGKDYYLDPGARFFPFGLLPWYESDAGGLLLNKDGGKFVATPEPSSSAAELIRHADIEINEEGEAAGKITVDFAGQYGALRRDDGHDEDNAGQRKDLGDEIKGWLPPDATFTVTNLQNWDDMTKPVHVEGTVKLPSFGTAAGKRLLIPLEVFHSTEAKSFKAEVRKNNLDFYFPYEKFDEIQIQLPKGYKIETSPKAQNVNLGQVSYEISATSDSAMVTVKRHLRIGGVMFPRSNYPVLREFFSRVTSNDEADIVLQNAETAKN